MNRPLNVILAGITLFGWMMLATGCAPTYPNCESDEHCQRDGHSEYCVTTLCKECREDAHCAKVNPCLECAGDNTCQKKAKCCLSDVECPGEKCWKVDADPTKPGECGDVCLNVQCPPGQKCAGGACVPDMTCVDDAGCPEGFSCVSGTCQKAECEIVTIFFDYHAFAIRLDQEERLASNASCLQKRAVPHRIEGHCDERGDGEYNLALGQKRANAVRRQYIDRGVSAAQISTLSYGKERPICTTFGEECWNQNRRAETTQNQ
jgi:peptidoglycan-associated lipoprotein